MEEFFCLEGFYSAPLPPNNPSHCLFANLPVKDCRFFSTLQCSASFCSLGNHGPAALFLLIFILGLSDPRDLPETFQYPSLDP